MLKYKCLLAEGTLCRKPHIAIDDPVAEFVSRYFEISTPESKIDRSEGPGEIDFFGAKNAVDYLRLPDKVKEIADKIEVISGDMVEIKATLEQVVGLLSKNTEGRTFESMINGLDAKQ